MNSPLIFIGMHRSGTTMISRFLDDIGVFMGDKMGKVNNEALFFQEINNWVLSQYNASWDNTYNYNFSNDYLREHLLKNINWHLENFQRRKFLGFNKYLKYKNVKDLDFTWGWKDPRSTITLDLWLEIFPQAKILHVYRNPIDVAESLRKRENLIKAKRKISWKSKFKETFLFNENLRYQESTRVENIYEGIYLWEEYLSRTLNIKEKYGVDILNIKYEDLLESPREYLEEIARLLDVDVKEQVLNKHISSVNKERRYAFKKSKELQEVYKNIRNRELMKYFGYDNLKID